MIAPVCWESLLIGSVGLRQYCNPQPPPHDRQTLHFSESVSRLENSVDNRFEHTSIVCSKNQITYVKIFSHIYSFQSHKHSIKVYDTKQSSISEGEDSGRRLYEKHPSVSFRLCAGPMQTHIQVTLVFCPFVLFPYTSYGFNYASWMISQLGFMDLEKQT